jgi:hypothetical protein
MAEFWAAIDADAKKHGESIWVFALKRARNNDAVLKAVLERALPMAAVVRLEDGGFVSSSTVAEEARVVQARRQLHAEIEAARETEVLVVDVAAVVNGTEEVVQNESEPRPKASPGNGKGNGKQATQA